MSDPRLKLEKLKVTVSQTVDGRFTVRSHSEPLFCVVRDTEEEIKDVVADTIKSYLATFYHIDLEEIKIIEEPATRRLPVETAKPLHNLLPRFDSLDIKGRDYAMA